MCKFLFLSCHGTRFIHPSTTFQSLFVTSFKDVRGNVLFSVKLDFLDSVAVGRETIEAVRLGNVLVVDPPRMMYELRTKRILADDKQRGKLQKLALRLPVPSSEPTVTGIKRMSS